MVITKIIAAYSRSINTKDYGGKESWIKFGRTYEAQIESSDDTKIASAHLHAQVKEDVNTVVNETIAKIKAAASGQQTVSGGNSAPAQQQQQPRSFN